MKKLKVLLLALLAVSLTVAGLPAHLATANSLSYEQDYHSPKPDTTNLDDLVPYLRVTYITSNPEEWVQLWPEDIDECITACLIEEAENDIPHIEITIDDLNAGLSISELFGGSDVENGVSMNAHTHAWGAWSDLYSTGLISHRKCIGLSGFCQLQWARYRYCNVPGYGCGSSQAEYVWSDLLTGCK